MGVLSGTSAPIQKAGGGGEGEVGAGGERGRGTGGGGTLLQLPNPNPPPDPPLGGGGGVCFRPNTNSGGAVRFRPDTKSGGVGGGGGCLEKRGRYLISKGGGGVRVVTTPQTSLYCIHPWGCLSKRTTNTWMCIK